MKTNPTPQTSLTGQPSGILRPARRQPFFQKSFPFFLCALLIPVFVSSSSAATLQLAGDLIVNLAPGDLNPATNVWTNRTIDPLSVGDMSTKGGSGTLLNVQSLSYSDAIVGTTNVNTLAVSDSGNNSVVSAGQVPAQIIGRGTVSAEVWIQANNVGAIGNTITSATVAYGVGSPHHQRDFNYCVGNGNGAVSGFADDANWTPQTFPTAGVWHYLAYTYDGTNFLAYQDGVLNTTANKSTWATLSGVMCVGSDGASGGGDPFQGNIAVARVMTGVLSASQISNNFNAGLFGAYDVIALPVAVSPSTNAFQGDTVTFTEVAQASESLTYQWYTDNGSGGTTFSSIGGATGTNYVLNTGSLSPGNYQYEVAVTGNTTVTTAPVTIHVSAPSVPVISQNITPATTSNLFVGSSISFSASFTGNHPITNQWQVSVNNGASFSDIPGATSTTLSLTDLQLTNSGEYRLVATNAIGHGNSSAAIVNVQPLSALPAVQVAGQLLIDLEPGDLNTNSATWINEINGVGDFTTVGGGNISGTNLTYNFQTINALAVDGNGSNALNSTLMMPLNAIGNSSISVEAWIYPTAISGNNTVVGYGVQGGSGAPGQDREFDFGNTGGSAFTGNFGGDTGWNGSLTANTWHYVVYTYDGTTITCYLDGTQNVANNIGGLSTVQSVAVIGGGIAGADPTTTNRTDIFNGNIATVRVETGVLTASQIANNYISGPTAPVSIVVSTPIISPTNSVFYGDTVTFTVTNTQSLQALTFQWQTDSGTGGATWSNIGGQTTTSYTLSTSSLPNPSSPINYGYRLVATGTSTVLASAPAILTVKPAAPPSVLTDTTPASATLFVGQQASFNATFAGNLPITNQWQVSTNHGASFANLAGQTGNTLSLSTLQVTNSGQYRLFASNAFGHTNSTPASLYVLPVSAEPQVEFAGAVIADLESAGLDTNAGLWHNESSDPNSVGDFTFVGTTGPLNVAATTYNLQPLNVLNVAGNGNNSVEALNTLTPSILLGSNACSMEAWLFATQVSSANTVVNYGDQSSQSGNLDRALNYQSQPYGAFTGYFGNADIGWNTAPTVGAWHYIAVTYDGSTITVYQDGVPNGGKSGVTLLTDQTYMSVGSGTGGGPFAGANPFSGYIASARVETGILSASQIAHNYTSGPAPGLSTVGVQELAPLNFSFSGGQMTLSWLAGTLQEATSLNGPWTTDTGTASPFIVTPATAGAPMKFYRLLY